MSTVWTVNSYIGLGGALILSLVAMIAWGRRTDQRNYGRAEAEAHIQSLRDFLPVRDVLTMPEVVEYETAVDAALQAGAEAR